MNTLTNFAKSVFAHIFAKFEYFAKVIIYSKSPDHVLQNDIEYVHILNVCNFFEQPFWSHCGAISRKLLIKSRNQNIFPIFKMNPIRC